jgi:hypothetical protein
VSGQWVAVQVDAPTDTDESNNNTEAKTNTVLR